MLHESDMLLPQAGEYILTEGAPLETDSRFFIIEDGAVECRKTFQVCLAVHLPTPKLPIQLHI